MFYQIKVFVVLFFLVLNVSLIAAEGEERTPERSGELAVAETPGKAAHRLQVEFFTGQWGLMQRVLGQGFVERLPSFAVLSDPDEKQNPQRSSALKKINTALERVKGGRQDEITLRGFVSQINSARAAIYSSRLEDQTRVYFTSGRFAEFHVRVEERDESEEGVQLSMKAYVSHNTEEMLYYVKTHSEGSLRPNPSRGIKAGSSTAGLLRPEELMAYKVLELLGVGCECHFFGRDPRNFYIATLSAHHGGAVFREYEKFVKGEDALRQSLWGCLDSLDRSSAVNEGNAAQIEENIGSDPIAQRFMQQTVLLDLLARIMRLTDFQTNSTNFGFIETDQGYLAKVLDFRMLPKEQLNASFQGFLDGNGLFDYSADKTMHYLLTDRLKHLRVQCAGSVFVLHLMGCGGEIGFVERAYNAVHQALSPLFLSGEDGGQVLRSLSVYKAALLHNFALFSMELANYRPTP